MVELGREHPGYGFERHKGYATAEHFAAIRRLGRSPIHRASFPVLGQILGEASPAFYALAAAIAAARTPVELEAVAAQAVAQAAALPLTDLRKLKVLLARGRQRLAG
jgi:hypothetical protein